MDSGLVRVLVLTPCSPASPWRFLFLFGQRLARARPDVRIDLHRLLARECVEARHASRQQRAVVHDGPETLRIERDARFTQIGRRAARRYQALETLYVASGGIAGPGSLGEPSAEVPVA